MSTERRRTDSGSNLLDLPPDVLLQILARLDSNYNRLISLSLICKSFRSLSNKLVRKLNFDVNPLPSASAFRSLLSRFPSVKQFAISSTGISHALDLIDRSGIKTECLEIFRNPKPRQIVISLSGRLELNLCGGDYYDWSDEGILKLAVNCRMLRKVNLDYCNNVTGCALDALALCCVDLECVSFVGCHKISFQNVMDFVQRAKKLKSLELPRYLFSNKIILPAPTLANSKPICESLSHLSVDGGLLKETFLLVIAGLSAPLTSLELKLLQLQHPTYTSTGLSAMLTAFPTLTRLNLHLPWPGSYAQDKMLSQLVKSLPYLKYVSLVSWFPVCSTLFSLINNCSVLECIYLKCWDYYTPWEPPQGIKMNHSIQHIYIDPWPDTLSKTALKLLCPSLKQ